MNINKRIGESSGAINRARQYFGYYGSLMLFLVFVKDYGWHWWYIPIIVVSIVFLWYDLNNIFPHEKRFLEKRSPYLTEILENTREIKKRLDKLEKK